MSLVLSERVKGKYKENFHREKISSKKISVQFLKKCVRRKKNYDRLKIAIMKK